MPNDIKANGFQVFVDKGRKFYYDKERYWCEFNDAGVR